MSIALKRAYEKPSKQDGYRVLVDRIWPRGVSKEEADIDEWMKEIAPTDQLRKLYHDNRISWGEFRKLYLSELKENRDNLRPLTEKAEEKKVTLVYGSKDKEKNNAVVLKQYLKMLGVE